MLNQKGGSKTDTLVKLVLIFFISLLSFSVGTFVGKQFSDSQYKMAALESESSTDAQRETASIDPKSLDVKPEDALTAEDVADLADEFVNNEKGSPSEIADRATASTGTGSSTVSEPAKKIAHGEEPIKKEIKHESKIPTEIPDVATGTVGKYTVQLSSHNNKDDAEKHAAELVAKGFSAFSVEAKVKEQTWYRVSVGLFTDYKSAEDYRKKLITQGTVKAAIVQKIIK